MHRKKLILSYLYNVCPKCSKACHRYHNTHVLWFILNIRIDRRLLLITKNKHTDIAMFAHYVFDANWTSDTDTIFIIIISSTNKLTNENSLPVLNPKSITSTLKPNISIVLFYLKHHAYLCLDLWFGKRKILLLFLTTVLNICV